MHLPTIFAKLQARLELRRLEDRYIRRSNRVTFTSNATYVDGEYVFPGSEYQRGAGSANNSGSKPGKLSFSSFASSNSRPSTESQGKKSWRYKGPVASVGNWSR